MNEPGENRQAPNNPPEDPFSTRRRIDLTREMIEQALAFEGVIPVGGDTISSKKCLLNEDHTVILSVPRPEIINHLYEYDPRIEYFPHKPIKAVALSGSGTKIVRLTTVGDVEYGKLVSDPLAERILNKYGDKNAIVLRGVACSINGGMYNPQTGCLVRDIRQIIELGDEQGRDFTLTGGLWELGQGEYTLHHRVNQYLVSGQARMRKLIGNPNFAKDPIFPALLVYDSTKLEYITGYSVGLPADVRERSKVVLKAFILDRPEDFLY